MGEKIKIGIVGCGFVGGALKTWIEEHNSENCEVYVSDPQHVVMSSLEAGITKYSHNVFGAYKVTYFNAVYDYCKKMGADWDRVHNGMLLSGYINGG